MSKRSLSTKVMVATKHKNNVVSCSTPDHQADSPSRDSDSVCDSEAASPVPFLCTQDGAEGETDVVWNYYTPKAEQNASSRIKNSTPLSRKARKTSRPKLIDRPAPKRKVINKVSHKKTALYQELMELNQNVHELISKKPSEVKEEKQSGSEEDIFSDLSGQSPKSCFKTNTRCLRKNLLSSKFPKPDTEPALESDDSMNECLFKASQVIEENILKATPPKKPRFEPKSRNITTSMNFQMDQDSMDAILNSIKLESPLVTRTKKCESPCLKNDSFDNLVGNLNDSTLDRLTQAPVNNKSKLNSSRNMDWMIDDIVLHEESMSKSFFGRHNSMPESPSINNKPSTSGMVITRYSSMPYGKAEKTTEPSDSPIRCTPDEIKRKHQQAREKLLAKRLLPFTSQSSQASQNPPVEIKKKQFQPKFSSTVSKPPNLASVASSMNTMPAKTESVASSLNQTANFQQNNINNLINDKSKDLKLLIEKKRQEALMKLRRRQK